MCRAVPRTSGALHFQHALFSAVLLECADKRGSDCEDSPLAVCGRAGLGTRGRRGIDDILVAAGDVGAVAGGVERGHGGRRGGEAVVGDEAWGSGGEEEVEEKQHSELTASTMRGGTGSVRVSRMCVCVIGRELT